MRTTANRVLLGAALLVATAGANADTFNGTNTGPIPPAPAGAPNCGVNNLGPAREVLFDVSGLSINVLSVNVLMNLDHDWRGDLVVRLEAPGGTPNMVLFSHTGSNVPTGCGHGGDLLGEYEFTDDTLRDWWGSAFTVVPANKYRTSAPGGTDPGGQPTLLNSVFRGLTPAQANGTWKLIIQDAGDADDGTIISAKLVIDQTDVIFKNGFETPTTP
ncbi:proprotein convertase P-domain-containing protein [Tahibacter amnicola]|uniref:Proprotein convertase P-domain-containing protein n=1 Tax=Tahibacter amnicola TaxID=2976241 RepID=A0ABY6BEH0_9GAMM|nr:proprotein convertase P-domain-containing protein [Tahibacter amnicola]UXI67942.1 proprotein convertase P-domain-containing protein [Tahibacter amnicola]